MTARAIASRLGTYLTDNPLLPAVAAIGFSVSFQTIAHQAQVRGMPGWPWLYPVGIDAGILALILEARALIARKRSDLVPRLLAWALTAGTIYVNAHGSPPRDWVGRALHIVMPCLWVVFLELRRRRWLADRQEYRPDRIPAGRWIASPLPTLLLWRRMRLLGVTSWPLMCAMEDARVFLRDSVRAVRSRHDVPVPLSVRRAIRTGRFPGEVSERIRSSLSYGGAATWEPSMESWLASRLGLSSTLSEALSNDRQQAPQDPPEPAPEAAPQAPPQTAPPAAPKTSPRTSPGAVRKPSASAVKRMTPGDLAPYVGMVLESAPGTTPTDLMKSLKIGRDKATEALKLARRERLQAVVEQGI